MNGRLSFVLKRLSSEVLVAREWVPASGSELLFEFLKLEIVIDWLSFICESSFQLSLCLQCLAVTSRDGVDGALADVRDLLKVSRPKF